MYDEKKLEEIKMKKEDWEKNHRGKAIAKFPERKEEFKTSSEIEIKPIYTPEDVKDIDYLEKLGFPGEYPYTRGVQPTMYRGKFWTMRQYAGYGTAEESNKRFKYLLEQGQTGLSVAFDLPTQIGYDSDHPMAEGEVGKVGVAIDSLYDMEILFDGIPLDKVSTSMTINAPAAILLAMYIAVAEKQGVSPDKLNGTIQNDILKEYVARGTYIFPTGPSMRLITNIFEYCSKYVPKWNTISISGYHMREAGATAVQEVAFTLANAIAYVDAAIKAGLDVDEFAPRISFFFSAHNDLFEEVAKFRAARRMWAKIMKERFGAKDPRSMMMRFHTQTAGSTLTAQQPDNNIIRVTIQALAAVLGGTQSLHTNSRDEALALPTEDSVRIALRTQQIIAYESGVCDTPDPLAGSYYVEYLTDEIEKRAFEYIKKIDELGGAVKAIDLGYMQREIQESAYRYQMEIESGKRIIVGLNKFQMEEEPPKNLLKVDPQVEIVQREKIKKVKEMRDNARVEKALKALKKAAEGDDNLMPWILDAVREYATLGEITDVLRSVFGEYQQQIIF
ncbi:methylmalonyl-CoA mutase N-terminal domain/subunit [Caldanaerobacter subterraneus subsp. tengcongensis MB4]|jgi:methylmalonyl-CoA mutase N-terminal domain/subunit|uniref:methylmalonyl-CoA mutase n=1 Tax=Caldanaerobacter subterraneus subsp. tengcongensis (strain DSM 15242 / JCM 11007 / NBRC 100824 / MB4) TaxID=273068 RepID=Q8R7L5_CALS4|nr:MULTISPECIES: methylmalonyl-CoA mutase family protein [Caldanaerobacter]AAM25528.1 Methylmalonyl-CoA mutase, N-terminal domain/subunit [Caldanaerobacter subterraneus subsp. tengcongensis MB4]MBE3579900.1 methylmalonyl-CoA mutase family protein [Caldanaerobacter subterraneus]MCS3914861.1 methylmalonyl-CoA mutase N-terminal domain/subunit [Caldanaerobacter subterraneus subsp. tengcongensis MB4]MDI3519324.1 methylmalonyl-CoA mutase, N-terminal domain [Caldanaerobacter sp.]